MSDNMDSKMALNAQIVAQGHSEGGLREVAASVKSPTAANSKQTEWNVGMESGGTFQEHWPEHLPRPPSMKRLDEAVDNSNAPRAIVFNANTREGGSLVRVLSERGLNVVAVVRVFTSKNTKNLTRLRNVTVKVADLNNKDAVIQAAQGCQQAFLVTKYWERFESSIEEAMAQTVLSASADAGIHKLVFATFENTADLRARKQKSQMMPTPEGLIYPKFDGKADIDEMGREKGVSVAHMMTSYFDEGDSKKSLILIRGENGKILTQSHIVEGKKS